MKEKIAMLWTGGKDSALALYELHLQHYQFDCLVTFVPSQGSFKAHPFAIIERQATALQIPHYYLEVSTPYEEGYRNALSELKSRGITTVATGDISEVDGYRNWVEQCCRPIELIVRKPLWNRPRAQLMKALIDNGFEVMFSYVDSRFLDREWAGQRLSLETLGRLQSLSEQSAIDLAGENGEFHTVVLDSPMFTKRIDTKELTIVTENKASYCQFQL